MQAFVLAVFVVVMLAPYAAQTVGGLRALAFLPELMSVLILPYLILEGARRRFPLLAPKYVIAFAVIALIGIGGIVANGVATASLLNGLRFYLRALPFFFLPAIVDFNERQVGQQLRWLLCIGLLQLPLAVYQRWIILSHGRFSGDDVQGTLTDSGTLSIFLICSALIVTGMYLRGQVNKWRLFPLLLVLLFPTAINETKVSAIYIPLGFLICVIIGTQRGRRMRVLGWSVGLMVAFAAIFVPIYNMMDANDPYKSEKTLASFFGNEKEVNRYFLRKDVKGLGEAKEVGRGDAIEVPVSYLAKDPIRLLLGLGLGNTSPSTLGPNYEGKYHQLFNPFLITSFTYFILEIGFLGVSALLVLYCLIFADAVAVCREPGVFGALAVGWTGITVLMCVSLVYSSIHLFDSLSYLYWYFSGLIAAQRVSLAQRRNIEAPMPSIRSAA